MDHHKFIRKQRQRRRFRVRKRLTGTTERPRLTVKRTHKHLYCQVIDDIDGKTLCAASTMDKDLRSQIKNGGNKDAAVIVGKAIADKANAVGIKAICLDRGQYKYHGRIAELANAVREAGINL